MLKPVQESDYFLEGDIFRESEDHTHEGAAGDQTGSEKIPFFQVFPFGPVLPHPGVF